MENAVSYLNQKTLEYLDKDPKKVQQLITTFLHQEGYPHLACHRIERTRELITIQLQEADNYCRKQLSVQEFLAYKLPLTEIIKGMIIEWLGPKPSVPDTSVAKLLGFPVYSDNLELMVWLTRVNHPENQLEVNQVKKIFPGLLEAVTYAVRDLALRRIQAASVTVLNGKARAWPSLDFWHTGPSLEFKLSNYTEPTWPR
jgi:hypothetical protein